MLNNLSPSEALRQSPVCWVMIAGNGIITRPEMELLPGMLTRT